MWQVLKIIFMLIPILFGRIYAGWPIWLNTILFLAMLFIPFFGFIIEGAAWIFALIEVAKSPFTLVSLLFYILFLFYVYSVVVALKEQ